MTSITEHSLLWIHCNKCFVLLAQKARLLLLSNCEHVLCTECIQRDESTSTTLCPICRMHIKLLPINNQLPDRFKVLFHPRPWEDKNHWIESIRFQTKQRNHLTCAFNVANSRFQQAQKMLADLKNDVKQAIKRREGYRKQRVIMEQYLNKLKETYRRRHARMILQSKSQSRHSRVLLGPLYSRSAYADFLEQ